MSIRNLLGLVLSIVVAGIMLWACSFKVEQIIIGELATAAGGKYKFLTILNLVNSFRSFNSHKEISVYMISASTSILLHPMRIELLLWLKQSLIYKSFVLTKIS